MSLQFDEQAALTLERMYQTPDVVGQRTRFHQTSALRHGESALDLGVGPRLLARERADCVGTTGALVGTDPWNFGPIRDFEGGRQEINQGEALAWRDELKQQEEEKGQYFFSLNRYLFAGIQV